MGTGATPGEQGSKPLSVVLAGGGTAGHVNPLLAIASAIVAKDPRTNITVVGTKSGLEARLVPQAGYPLETIPKVPFPRKPNLDALAFPVRWISEVRCVEHILKDTHADVVVGVGGYAAAPAYKAARRLGLPIVIHEQNARAGMANKLGAKWATFVGTAYENTDLKVSAQGTIRRVGLPLRPAIASTASDMQKDPATARQSAAYQLGLDPNRPILLVTGGSLGALSVNGAVAGACKDLLACAQIVHLCGAGKADAVRRTVVAAVGENRLAGIGPEWAGKGDYHLAEYFEHIELALACADLVICRAGAGTVSEIAALGVPAIYVPLSIGNGEQRYNAEPVVKAGGGLLVDDANFTVDWVARTVPQLLSEPAKLEDMRAAEWRYGVRDAAAQMADAVITIGRKGQRQ